MTAGDGTWRPLGISCLALAAGTAWIASDYALGTVTAMGPGFIPLVVAAFLFLMGVLILLARGKDVASSEDVDDEDAPVAGLPAMSRLGTMRAIGAIIASIVVFGLAIKPLGLAITTFLVVLIGVYANRAARPLPALLLAAGLSAAACLLFVTLLGLQIGLFPRFE